MNPVTIPQGALVRCREAFKADGRFTGKPGQMFWVACAMYSRPARQHILLARSGQNSATAKAYSFADAERYFEPVSTFQPVS